MIKQVIKKRQISHILVLFAAILLLSSPVTAAIYLANGTEIQADDLFSSMKTDPSQIREYVSEDKIIFFTNSQCGACHSVSKTLDEFTAIFPEIEIISYDIFDSSKNRTVFEEYKREYHRDYLSVPSIIIVDLVIEGSQDMNTFLDEMMGSRPKKE